MLYTRSLASGTEQEFHWHESPTTGLPTYITMSPGQAHGQWKALTHTSATTGIIVSPKSGLSLAMTDLIVTGTKDNTNTATIQYTDGTDTEIIIVAAQSTNPPNIAMGFQSYFTGWKDARIELVTSGTNSVTVTVGYIHTIEEQSFSEWNAKR